MSVTNFADNGTEVGRRSYDLRPFEFIQRNGAFGDVTSSALPEGYVSLECTTENCRFLSFATVIDNRSGDPICSLAW